MLWLFVYNSAGVYINLILTARYRYPKHIYMVMSSWYDTVLSKSFRLKEEMTKPILNGCIKYNTSMTV